MMHNNINFGSPVIYLRRLTNTVNIGGIPLGSDYPVRIQSMSNTPTSDIPGSVAQCIRIIKAGADYVRLTVPSLNDVNAIAAIKQELVKQGYRAPVIADVHFSAEIALKVADHVDKVRINPGNFTNMEMFIPLLEKCRAKGVALRIGVNHGSLSERIMNKFGDTPSGMAESAMEFLRICRDRHFDQVVLSMKASNVRVMVQSTRLVARRMQDEGMKFPLHLGVTEAGEGEDGRIKSAVGIGTLLAEGLGDTIRVSLTEEPEAEVPVARKLADQVNLISQIGRAGEEETGRLIKTERVGEQERWSVEFEHRKTRITGNIGGSFPPVVYGADDIDGNIKLVNVASGELSASLIHQLTADQHAVLVYEPKNINIHAELGWLRSRLKEMKCDVPVIFRLNLNEKTPENFMLKAAASMGGAFIDGFGDGIWLTNEFPMDQHLINSVSLGILQACRARVSKTEYISCPSCGRTHFNLMEALSRIKAATSHLKGLKIGVMGCIVNGPGEMADADYGYVGAGKGKITLYKSKEVIKKGIPEADAVNELVSLIKENGDWVEPPHP